jgi:hypothetical protein
MISGSLMIITFVQVVNWYSKKAIPYVLAVFFWSQALGYITWINIPFSWNACKYLIACAIFIPIAFFDGFYFYFAPTQANILIGESTRTKEEMMKFEAYKQTAVSNQGVSVHHLAKKDAREERISLLTPFRHLDFILLLISASFKVGASRVNYDITGLVNDFYHGGTY